MKVEDKIPTPNFDAIDPRLCLNSKLRRLHRMLNTAYQRKLHPFGLRSSTLSILFIIGKRKHINQKSLAERLVIDQSTMSRDLKRLTERGLVKITKGKDTRHSELELTNAGYELLEQVVPVWAAMQSSISAVFGEFHIQQLDVLTNAVQHHLDKHD